jgi:pimeloyl-ACP methyl ester carboxylesterase
MSFPITEHTLKTPRHTTGYLACGREDGPLVIFIHGWPELSLSWRHQLPVLAALGFRCIAPDMRGYGHSTVYRRHEDYALEHSTADMIELLDSLGREQAVWVGHDWGSPVVWSIASHHPDRALGVANLCVPYIPEGFTLENLIPLVDRRIYPAEGYPAGQWDYQVYYQESFEAASRAFDSDPYKVAKLLFRKGNPAGVGQPSATSMTRKQGGWFRGGVVPDVPRDGDVVSEADLSVYAASLARNGFFGPDAWYMNHERNGDFAKRAVNGGRLDTPVLFLHGRYDFTCETVESRLAEPMRGACADLTEAIVDSGHWMAQEKPVEVNSALARWLAGKFPELWPG